MKTTLISALVCAALSAASIHVADAATIAVSTVPHAALAVTEATDTGAGAPALTPVWWGGPNTVCHYGYYGAFCHRAYVRPWIPGHRTWNGFWIPGHWA